MLDCEALLAQALKPLFLSYSTAAKVLTASPQTNSGSIRALEPAAQVCGNLSEVGSQ